MTCGYCISIALTMYFGERNGTPLQYSCLENPMGRGAWWAAVHGVVTSRTRLSDFTSLTMYLPSYPHLTHEGSEKPCDLPIVLQVVSGGVGI